VIAGAGGLLAACGKANRTAATTHSTSSAPSGAAARPLTKPQALALAHAVNLTTADVRGFHASEGRHSEGAQEKLFERGLLRCVGSPGSGGKLAEVASRNFELDRGILQFTVSSEVSVAPTATAAARELATVRSARVRGCLGHSLDQLLNRQRASGGGTVGPVAVASGTPPAPGTAGSFGWRVTATYTLRGITLSFYLDMLGFVQGPATVTLFSTGVLQPFPAAAQQRLFSLLLSRAKVHIP
jgi:hypothetical protein